MITGGFILEGFLHVYYYNYILLFGGAPENFEWYVNADLLFYNFKILELNGAC